MTFARNVPPSLKGKGDRGKGSYQRTLAKKLCTHTLTPTRMNFLLIFAQKCGKIRRIQGKDVIARWFLSAGQEIVTKSARFYMNGCLK